MFEFVITGGNIVNPLSIDPNERVTPSHHSGNNGLIDPMVDPTSGDMNHVVNQNGINGNMGIDGAELMASLAVTEIGVIPPPPMFSCSPSPPPPPPPPSSAIDHRSSQQSAHSTSSVVQPGHIITVSSHMLHPHQSSNLTPQQHIQQQQQQSVQASNNVFHNHPHSSVQMTNSNSSSVVTVMSNSNNHSHSQYHHPHAHHDPRHLNAYEYQHHPGNSLLKSIEIINICLLYNFFAVTNFFLLFYFYSR